MKNPTTAALIFLFTTIALVLNAVTAPAQSQEITIKRSVDLRNGPGSYYDLVFRVNRGATVRQLGKQEGWLQVYFQGQEGWMPDHPVYYGVGTEYGSGDEPADALESTRDRMKRMFGEFATSPDTGAASDLYATPAQVAAAVKGFARKYETRRGMTNVDFSRSFDHRINIREYRRFRKDRIRDYQWSVAKERFPIDTDTIPPYTPDIEKLGWAIASSIAADGLYEDYELQKYLNYVSLVVTESSHRYELPVQLHILDTEDVVGYGTPNGIIFVSKGALRLMETEAEFAFFVGHELAHVVLQHGVQETEDRAVKIDSDDAFGELDRELDYGERPNDEFVQVSGDLSAMADQVYEYMISDRLEAYEHEADLWGMAYAYRAGYNPRAAVNLLNRFRQNEGNFETRIGELKWMGTDIDDRIGRCHNHLTRMTRYPQLNDDNRSEFQQMKSRLN